MRRALSSSAARLLCRELLAEGSGSARQVAGCRAALVGSALGAGSWAAPAGLAPAASGRPGTVRTFADEPYFNSIIYPDSELEVGGPAPDFTLAGGLEVVGGSGAPLG